MADLTPARVLTLEPRDLYTLPIVGWCALDPSRTAVAYAVTRLHEEANAYRGSIRVVQIGAERGDATSASPPTDARTLTDGSARDQAPQWSADGSSIFFLSDRGGSMQLWRVDAKGGEPKALPALPGNVSEFAVSPGGAKIAAVATPTTNKDQIQQQGWRRIGRIRYRSDGLGYLDDMPQIWLIDVASATVARVTDGSGFVAGVAWSPSGEDLAFAGDHQTDADSLWRRELWTASAGRGWKPIRIQTFGTAVEAPAWSPDGTRIAFCGIEVPPGNGLRNLRLYTVQADGRNPICLTSDEEWTCGNFVLTDIGSAGTIVAPVWISDDEIAVLASSRGAARVFRVLPGARAQPLTPQTLSVGQFALLDRERALYCASGPIAPPELYLSRTADDAIALTRETETWRLDRKAAPATCFRVKNAGNEIDAWHFAGNGPQPRPAILYIHGGPHFAYGNAFVFHFLTLAAAGYDVLLCNPRGSQSYGEPFADAIRGNWAQPAFDDCMAALDAAIERFRIDPARLGVAGGSYGGYLTLWVISHTSRFAAAVALRPAANLTSLWGTSEVGRMLAEDFGGRPFDAREVYERDSPLWHADAITTPLLVVFGDQDYRTPAEQSEQMLTALMERGATVEALQLLGTDHNLSRGGPPRLRVVHEEAIRDWFARFLS